MEIIGHKKQWEFLKKQFLLSQVPHALLFSGEERVGKKTIALEFLKLLNCQEPDFLKKPCGVCASCRAMEKKVHADLSFIEPEKGKIGIFQIRELIRAFSLRPYFQWKGAILDQAHLMTEEAQNCLLKTLEEPKGQTCLILISEYPSLLAETIVSRIQEIKFFPVKRKEIVNYLIGKGIGESQALKIAEISSGKPGLALEFLSKPEKMEEWERRVEELYLLSKKDLAFRFQYAKSLSSKPGELKETLNIWLSHLRKVMLKRPKESSKIKEIIQRIEEIRSLLSNKSINTRLALENLFLQL